MCGIVGYIGPRKASSVLMDELTKLEYRGYDSVGIAVLDEKGKRSLLKRKGRVLGIEEDAKKIEGHIGVGHTRWATHGVPSDKNSHPHVSGKFTVVHNGIIENFLDLKVELVNEGVKFMSETDTEVVAHMLTKYYDGNFLSTVKKATSRLTGAYALAILCEDFPDTIMVAKKDNPIIIGKGDNECFIASDIPAIAAYTKKVFFLNDGEFAEIKQDVITFFDNNLKVLDKKISVIDIDEDSLGTGGYESYMLKEINEVPSSIADTAIFLKRMILPSNFEEKILNASRFIITGCGTAYHSGLVGKNIIEKYCRKIVDIDIASEFRYKNPIIDNRTVLVAVSQSGETADTIAAVKLAKKQGAYIIAITNVLYSSLTTFADVTLHLKAGTEIGVAATKSYNCQLVAFYYLAEQIAKVYDIPLSFLDDIITGSEKIHDVLSNGITFKRLAQKYAHYNSVFFLGRGLDYCVALEGALKLKEISYMHAEGYASGELKHGPLALIEKGTLAIVLMSQEDLLDKTLNCVHEVQSRGATVCVLSQYDASSFRNQVDEVYELPKVSDDLMPLIEIVPLQMFSYYMARGRGFDPDKPRNLAKSVTVE